MEKSKEKQLKTSKEVAQTKKVAVKKVKAEVSKTVVKPILKVEEPSNNTTKAKVEVKTTIKKEKPALTATRKTTVKKVEDKKVENKKIADKKPATKKANTAKQNVTTFGVIEDGEVFPFPMNEKQIDRYMKAKKAKEAEKENTTIAKNKNITEEVGKAQTTTVLQVKEEAKPNKDKKVLYVVSECQPFCATGGLADVAGGLPKQIENNSTIDIRVVLPMYSDIPEVYRKDFKFVGWKNVPLAWRSVYCGVFTYVLDGVTYYFLDNEYYFKRGGGIYSYYDDGERFAFMSRAVIEILPLINFIPDIIHCNDWQSALVPIYLKTVYNNNNDFNKIKTVFTLHNTEYQGKYDIKLISDLFGIDGKNTSLVEYNKDMNLVKGAVCCCDKFTTVSPAYAQEILGPEHSNGLDSILRQNTYKSCGILNGIDYDFYNPQTDKGIYKNYIVKSLQDKKQNKTSFQKEYGLNVNENTPLLAIVSRLAKHKGFDLIKNCIESVLCDDVQLVVVGNGEKDYEDYFKYLENKYKGKVRALLGYSNLIARRAYSASDIFLMPSLSEPCGLSQMIASRYGSVPIVREVGGLKCSIKDFGCAEGGNGYTFANYNANDLLYSIKRALNDYKDKPNWEKKMQVCMNADFSWKDSANKYVDLYNEITK